MSHKISRRSTLALLGATATTSFARNPLDMLFGGIAEGLIQRAEAQTTGLNPRKYIYIQQPGAPGHWFWDLFLTPYSADGFLANPMVINRYVATNGVYTHGQYATVLRKGINVPYIWQFPVPHSNGGTRPMDDLLTNMLQIRGINTANDAHEGAQQMNFRPLGALQSIPALSADAGSAPLSAINVRTDRYTFQSKAGISPVFLANGGSTNIIQRLMDPFANNASSAFKTRKDAVNTSIQKAVTALETYAKSEHPGAENINRSRRQAEELMRGSFGDLSTVYSGLFNKYDTLIKRSLRYGYDSTMRLTGINDLPIGTSGGRDLNYQFGDGELIGDADLRTMFSTSSYIWNMAENFALAEFAVLNNLTDSLAFRIDSIDRLSINGSTRGHHYDGHFFGSMPSLVIQSIHSIAFAACLLEFFDQLKLKGMFNDTVVHIGGEFGRNPKTNGAGSDHASGAQSVALYSGAVTGPMVLGNCRHGSTSGSYVGSWGLGAGITAFGNQVLDLGHLASTIAVMLRVPSPISARPPIVAEQSGRIVATIELAKQVA
jgi:hypothetical protein